MKAYLISRCMLLAVVAMLSMGCATSRCLTTPASSKVSRAAVQRCSQEHRAEPTRRDLFDRYVRLLWARQDYRQMARVSVSVLRADRQRTDARYFFAVSLRKLQRCAKAVKHYRRYAAAQPTDPDPHFGMGLCYERLNQRPAAIAAFERYLALERRPQQQQWRQLAQKRLAALGSTRPVVAIRRAPTAAKASVIPKKAMARTPRVKPRRRIAPMPKARRPAADCGVHERAVRTNPFDTKAYDAFARCGLGRGDHGAVLRRLRIGVRDNPEYARGWLHIGDAHRVAKRPAQAKRAYQKACRGGIGVACTR